jgi:hypothetical protein
MRKGICKARGLERKRKDGRGDEVYKKQKFMTPAMSGVAPNLPWGTRHESAPKPSKTHKDLQTLRPHYFT